MTEYTYRAMWSPAAGSYVGTCLEFPGLRQHRETAGEAIAATEQRMSLNHGWYRSWSAARVPEASEPMMDSHMRYCRRYYRRVQYHR